MKLSTEAILFKNPEDEKNTRQAAIAKLQQLSEPSLEKVNQLLDSLLIEQQTQALETPSEQTLKEKW